MVSSTAPPASKARRRPVQSVIGPTEIEGRWGVRAGWLYCGRMENHPETEEEIQEEMRELGIDNDATGAPDVMMSGNVVRVVAAVLVLLMLAGALLLVF